MTDLLKAIRSAIESGAEIRINGSSPIVSARLSVSGTFLVLHDADWHPHGIWPDSPLWQALEVLL